MAPTARFRVRVRPGVSVSVRVSVMVRVRPGVSVSVRVSVSERATVWATVSERARHWVRVLRIVGRPFGT